MDKKRTKVLPIEFKVDVLQWLILNRRYVYTARKPKCGAYIIEDLCRFKGSIKAPCKKAP